MYYRDCTKAYAAAVVQEILENHDPAPALNLIRSFMDNEITTDEIYDYS